MKIWSIEALAKVSILLLCSMSSMYGEIAFSTTGTVYPEAQATLVAQVSGRVENVLVDVGDAVDKGQTLLTLDPIFFTIDVAQKKASLKQSQVKVYEAKLDYDRMKKLWEKPSGERPAIPQKRYDDAKIRFQEAAVQSLTAEEELKRAEANFAESIVKAPFTGLISKRFVDAGDGVSQLATELFEIEDIESVDIEFSVPQNMLETFEEGSTVILDCKEAALSNFSAICTRIFPNVDMKTRSVRCRVTLENKEHKLLPGMLLNVKIPSKEVPANEGVRP